MVGRESRELVTTQIKNILLGKNKSDNMKILHGELVQTGKVPNTEINRLVSLRENIEEFDVNYLCLIYMTLAKYNKLLKSVETYFTPIEIESANNYILKRTDVCFPLIFENCQKMTANEKEFKFFLTIQQINQLSINGLLKIVEGMQRESETIYYRGKIENHVAYNDKVARKICESMIANDYHPTDDIKIHYIGDDYEITDDGEIIINSGDLILLDGQHRVRGIEYAMNENQSLYYKFSINLSFGSTEYAQSIIEQHEKRQPIKKQVLETYKKTEENNIFKLFSTDSKIESEYKFVDIPSAEQSNAGFIIKSDFISAVKRYYKSADLSQKEQRKVAKWLVTFFDELYVEYEDDIKNYIQVKKSKWNVRSYAYDGFVYLSSYLYNQDIDDNMRVEMAMHILETIDFTSEIKSTNKYRECLNIIKEAVDKYVK